MAKLQKQYGPYHHHSVSSVSNLHRYALEKQKYSSFVVQSLSLPQCVEQAVMMQVSTTTMTTTTTSPPTSPKTPNTPQIASNANFLSELEFENIFSHPVTFAMFQEFVKAEYNEENLNFYFAVQNYHTQGAKMPHKYQPLAWEIFDVYIDKNASTPINLPASVVTEIMQDMQQGKFAAHMFDVAMANVLNSLKTESFVRFKVSDTFYKFVMQSSTALLVEVKNSNSDNLSGMVSPDLIVAYEKTKITPQQVLEKRKSVRDMMDKRKSGVFSAFSLNLPPNTDGDTPKSPKLSPHLKDEGTNGAKRYSLSDTFRKLIVGKGTDASDELKRKSLTNRLSMTLNNLLGNNK